LELELFHSGTGSQGQYYPVTLQVTNTGNQDLFINNGPDRGIYCPSESSACNSIFLRENDYVAINDTNPLHPGEIKTANMSFGFCGAGGEICCSRELGSCFEPPPPGCYFGFLGVRGGTSIDAMEILDIEPLEIHLLPDPGSDIVPPKAAIAALPELELVGCCVKATLDASPSEPGSKLFNYFLWQKLEGPAGDQIAAPQAMRTEVIFIHPGRYVYRVTVGNEEPSYDCETIIIAVVSSETLPVFIRGDANQNGAIDISDAVAILGSLFLDGDEPRCFDAADINDDGRLDISDAVAGLAFLFLGGFSIPDPGPTFCGQDLTVDELQLCHYEEGLCSL
jgi:hypothetical protein